MTAFKKTFFGKIVEKITGFWNKSAEPFLKSLIEPVIPSLKSLAKSEAEAVGKAIVESIKASAKSGLSPSKWLQPAFEAAEAALENLGRNLPSEAINLIVTAYQAQTKAEAADRGVLVKDL